MLNVILALLAVRSFLNNVWIFHACKKLHYRYRPSPATLRPDRQITILLPVLQEAAIIERAVRYIEVCREGLGQVELYIIGTARERDESGTNPTLEHAEASARQLGRVHIIEAPRTDGWMVHQLNYAFSHLIATSRHPRKEWIFLINVDSQFSREGLEEMIGYINQGVPVLHQCAVFLSNFAALRAPLKAFALWQSRWTLAHELKRFALNRKCSYALMHVVGHGLCINLDTVSRYNGFPEETLTEDLHFGFYLAAAGEKVVSLRTIEMADHPTTLTDVFRQKYVWSFGPMLYIRYLQAFRRKFPAKWRANRIRPIVLTLQGLLSFLSWSSTSWFLIVAALLAPASSLAVTFILLYLLEYLQCAVYFVKSGLMRGRDACLAVMLLPVAALTHSLPANLALINALLGRRTSKFKTSHE